MLAAVIVIVALAVIAAIVAVVVASSRRRRRAQLQERFGPEWDRSVGQTGSRRAAAADLQERVDRRQEHDIHPLSAASRDRYQQQWRDVQSQFVDQPSVSLTRADALVTEVMRESGYPMERFDSQAELLSVDHPAVIGQYRTAHDIFVGNQTTPASTEDVRRAFMSYRALFSDLLGTADPQLDRSAETRR